MARAAAGSGAHRFRSLRLGRPPVPEPSLGLDLAALADALAPGDARGSRPADASGGQGVAARAWRPGRGGQGTCPMSTRVTLSNRCRCRAGSPDPPGGTEYGVRAQAARLGDARLGGCWVAGPPALFSATPAGVEQLHDPTTAAISAVAPPQGRDPRPIAARSSPSLRRRRRHLENQGPRRRGSHGSPSEASETRSGACVRPAKPEARPAIHAPAENPQRRRARRTRGEGAANPRRARPGIKAPGRETAGRFDYGPKNPTCRAPPLP